MSNPIMRETILARLEQARDACEDAIETIETLKQENKELTEEVANSSKDVARLEEDVLQWKIKHDKLKYSETNHA